MGKRVKIILFGVLVFVDQGIKMIIREWFFERNFSLIGEYVTFRPIVNKKYSYVGHFISFFSIKSVTILMGFLAIPIFITLYRFLETRPLKGKKLMEVTFVFAMAGCSCSLIDRNIWDGSLDYVKLFDWFIFDLKDCYLSAFNVSIIYLVARNIKELNAMKFADFRAWWKESNQRK